MSDLPAGESLPKNTDLRQSASRQDWERPWPQSVEEFEALVETFQHRLVQYAFRRLGCLEDAEDAIQRIFVRAYLDRHRRQKVIRVGSYLFRMAANECTDLLRSRRRRSRHLEGIPIEEAGTARTDSAKEAAFTREMQRIEELLSPLPGPQAEVIRLRVYDDLRFREIAGVLGCSTATVKSRFRYGLEKLRAIIVDKDWEVAR